MKKVLSIVIALVLVAACFVGCAPKGKTLAQVKEAGKLVMATSPDFPPFETLGENGVEGIEVEIMQLIAQKLGVELDIQQMDFDSVLNGIAAAKYDVAVSGITITEKRQKNMLFTDAYFLAKQAIVVKEGSPITGKADLTGKKVSAQTGTTAESFCMENGYAVSSFNANSDAQAALTAGRVDAWVIDNLTAVEMVEEYNAESTEKLVILNDYMTTEPYAFAFAFGSEDLVAEINKALNELIDDGTIQGIFDKYEVEYLSPAVDEK